MTISAVATEAKAILCVAECRRCLKLGVDMKAPYIKMVLDQLENQTVTNVTSFADIGQDNTNDGRNAAEIVAVT